MSSVVGVNLVLEALVNGVRIHRDVEEAWPSRIRSGFEALLLRQGQADLWVWGQPGLQRESLSQNN